MKTIAQQLNVKDFPFIVKDSNGNQIYYEEPNGSWTKREFDSEGNMIYFEDSNSYWSKSEYDSKSNRIYYERSDGYWFKKEYDSKGNLIYFENSDGLIEDKRKIPEFTMEELVEKLGNFKLIK